MHLLACIVIFVSHTALLLMHLYSTEVHKMPVAVILQWRYTLAQSVENIITACVFACTEWRRECTTALYVSETILSDKVDTQAPVLLPCYC